MTVIDNFSRRIDHLSLVCAPNLANTVWYPQGAAGGGGGLSFLSFFLKVFCHQYFVYFVNCYAN